MTYDLPPSSPFPASSPVSSPARPAVNLVSSPGPMGPATPASNYPSLPFTLPPGPYSKSKPELSYAALIGRAVLSSPRHRLTLQEIYEYITIVFPYYTRDEQTWQNSVRHVLSTTPCFRKCPRERGEGKTQWAIWDKDLKCFEGGGFDKRFCDDVPVKKSAGAKRPAAALQTDTGAGPSSGGGRRKKRKGDPDPLPEAPAPLPALPTALGGAPLFPPRPGSAGHPFHTPYYAHATGHGAQTRQHTDVLFPPLPPSAGLAQPVRLPPVDTGSIAGSSAPSRASSAMSIRDAKVKEEEEEEELPLPSASQTSAPRPPWLSGASSSPVTSRASSPPPSSQVPDLVPTSEGEPSSSSPPLLSDLPDGGEEGEDELSEEHLRAIEAALAADPEGELPMPLRNLDRTAAAAAGSAHAHAHSQLPALGQLTNVQARSPSVDLDEYMNFTSPLGGTPALMEGITLNKHSSVKVNASCQTLLNLGADADGTGQDASHLRHGRQPDSCRAEGEKSVDWLRPWRRTAAFLPNRAAKRNASAVIRQCDGRVVEQESAHDDAPAEAFWSVRLRLRQPWTFAPTHACVTYGLAHEPERVPSSLQDASGSTRTRGTLWTVRGLIRPRIRSLPGLWWPRLVRVRP
jgi:hypothetical protein